jgi:hypothetical protein
VKVEHNFVKVEHKKEDRQRRILEMVRGDRRELIVHTLKEPERDR